jgi:hypothetical protein
MLKISALAVFLVIFQSCSLNENPSDFNSKQIENILLIENSNHNQIGEFFYVQAKYYPDLESNLDLLTPEMKIEFEKLLLDRGNIQATEDELKSELAILQEKNQISQTHSDFLINYIDELKSKLENDGLSDDELWNWGKEREREVVENQIMSNLDKEILLNVLSINRNYLKIEKERFDLNEGYSSDEAYKTLSCNVATRIFCWTSTIITWAYKGYTATGGSMVAGGLPGIIVGAIVGINQAIQNCNTCGTATCERFDAIAFDFKCYNFPSDFMRVKGLGGGAITASQYHWLFYKNGSTTNDFHGNFTSIKQYDLPGNQITNNSVTSFAIAARSNCSGIWKDSDFIGWYDVNQLGKPNFVMTGSFFVQQSQLPIGQTYEVMGSVRSAQNATVVWELLPPGNGYDASGTILYGGYGNSVTIAWNSTPGVARLKCTATTTCGTVQQIWHVIIQGN